MEKNHVSKIPEASVLGLRPSSSNSRKQGRSNKNWAWGCVSVCLCVRAFELWLTAVHKTRRETRQFSANSCVTCTAPLLERFAASFNHLSDVNSVQRLFVGPFSRLDGRFLRRSPRLAFNGLASRTQRRQWRHTTTQQHHVLINVTPSPGNIRKCIYIAPFILGTVSKRSDMDHICKLHHACLSFVSVHQMAPLLNEVADIQLQLTIHLSTPKGWKAELAWLVNL